MKIRAVMKTVGARTRSQEGCLLAVGDVFIDDLIVIHNVKVVTKVDEDGILKEKVVMPSRKKGDEWTKLVRVLDKDIYRQIHEVVMDDFREAVDRDRKGFDLKVDIRIYENGDTKAYATVTYNDVIQIDGIRVVQEDGDEEPKIFYPFEKVGDAYYNVAGPLTSYVRSGMDADIRYAYEKKKREHEMDAPKEERGISR